MKTQAPKEIRIVKTQTSFLVAGWIFALVVLAGAIGGGVWFWRRAQVTSQALRAQVAEKIQARQRPQAIAPEEAEPTPPPVADPAQTPAPSPSGAEGRIGLSSRKNPRPTAGSDGGQGKLAIQRVVRSHLDEIKLCYEAGRKQNPTLSGRVTVQFVIGSRGQVSTSAIKSSSLGNIRTETCLLQAIRRWEFPPPPNGANVAIVYPFDFQPGN